MFRLNRRHVGEHRLVCVECGDGFGALSPKAKYCGSRCRDRAKARRERSPDRVPCEYGWPFVCIGCGSWCYARWSNKEVCSECAASREARVKLEYADRVGRGRRVASADLEKILEALPDVFCAHELRAAWEKVCGPLTSSYSMGGIARQMIRKGYIVATGGRTMNERRRKVREYRKGNI